MENLRPFRNIRDAKVTRQSIEPFNDIKEIPERPGYIIKESVENEWWGPEKEKIRRIDQIKKYLKRITDPRNGIADHIPLTELVLGQRDQYRTNVYTIQERIEGIYISKERAWEAFADEPDGEMAQAVTQIGKIVKGVIRVYLETFKDGVGSSVETINLKNFLYGVNLARPELGKKVFLTDMVPIYEDTPKDVISELGDFLETLPMLKPAFEEEMKQLESLQSKTPA